MLIEQVLGACQPAIVESKRRNTAARSFLRDEFTVVRFWESSDNHKGVTAGECLPASRVPSASHPDFRPQSTPVSHRDRRRLLRSLKLPECVWPVCLDDALPGHGQRDALSQIP